MIAKISIDEREEFIQFISRHLPEIRYYNPTFIDRRLATIINKMGHFSWNSFISQAKQDNQFIDSFLRDFTVPVTEFFRDVELWTYLKNTYLQKVKYHDTFRVWIPELSTGEELYSLCILLHEKNMLEKTVIYAGSKSQKSIEVTKSGRYPLTHEQNLYSSLKTLGVSIEKDKLYAKTHNTLIFNSSLLQKVQFMHAHSVLAQHPSNIDLVLYRNSLLYLTNEFQHRFISHIYNALEYGGHMILGLKEGPSVFEIETLFKLEQKVERIYRKK